MKKFPPLKADHPLLVDGERCAACDELFLAGDVTTVVAVGPGNDPQAQALAREGLPYTGRAVCVHWSCATGEV